MWRLLRDRRFAGVKFRRQVPVGPFVVDFASMEHRLIVELDGGQHAESAADGPPLIPHVALARSLNMLAATVSFESVSPDVAIS
jgi:hypothetical protein